MSEQRPFKVGDDVFCLIFGHGSVSYMDGDRLSVACADSSVPSYTLDGRYLAGQNRTLYHANSGIIEIDTTLRPELEVDAKIWVRDGDDARWNTAHFKEWKHGMATCFDLGRTSFTEDGHDHTWNFYTLTDPNGEQD